jgi:hypothetical protein
MDALNTALEYLNDSEELVNSVIVIIDNETYEILKQDDQFVVFFKNEEYGGEFEPEGEYETIDELLDDYRNNDISRVFFNETKLYPIDMTRTVNKILSFQQNRRTNFGKKIDSDILFFTQTAHCFLILDLCL